MKKTYLYIPDETYSKLEIIIDVQKRSKASVLREAINIGLNIIIKDIPSKLLGLKSPWDD